MSVIVKGMKMPENCLKCIQSGFRTAIGCAEWAKISAGLRETERALSCPVSALPDKHGRLVDADADSLKNKLKFINEAEHQIYGRGSWGFTAKCIHAIDDAPTIVEAEGEE